MNNFSWNFSERQRKNAVDTFLKLKSELLDYKNKIISEELALVDWIHKVNIETLKALQTYSKNLDKIISQILSWNQIDQSQLNRGLRILLALPSIDLSQFKKIFFPSLSKSSVCSSECMIQRFWKPEKILPWNQSKFQEESKKFKTYSLNFVKGEEILASFDAKRKKATESKRLIQKIDGKAAKCLLPDGNLFFHTKDKCMILYPFNYVRSMPAYKSNFLTACAIYIDGFVYLFGDSQTNPAKLNINDEKWISLATIPFKFGQNSICAQFKNYILLCSGISTSIIYYDIAVDSYSEISLNSLREVIKAIFVKNDKAFLLNSYFIYESYENLMVWNKVGNCSSLFPYTPIISHSIEYKGKFYFANSYGVYSFDFKEKCIENWKI